jgi:hypothetical protein
MAKLKNSKPKQGMGLHKFVATGGKPKDYKGCASKTVVKGNKTKKY